MVAGRGSNSHENHPKVGCFPPNYFVCVEIDVIMDPLTPVEREGVRQKIIDRLLLLYLYKRVTDQSRITGDTKLQKLAFLSEKSMLDRDANGLHYKFFRWEHGPMSKEVYEDREFLEENDMVSQHWGKINKKGRDILEQASPVLEENQSFLDDIDTVIDEYGKHSGGSLKDIVYDIELTPLTMRRSLKIQDIPETTDIIFPLPEDKAKDSFYLPDGWVHTLVKIMDDSAEQKLDESIRLAQNHEGEEFHFEYVEPT